MARKHPDNPRYKKNYDSYDNSWIFTITQLNAYQTSFKNATNCLIHPAPSRLLFLKPKPHISKSARLRPGSATVNSSNRQLLPCFGVSGVCGFHHDFTTIDLWKLRARLFGIIVSERPWALFAVGWKFVVLRKIHLGVGACLESGLVCVAISTLIFRNIAWGTVGRFSVGTSLWPQGSTKPLIFKTSLLIVFWLAIGSAFDLSCIKLRLARSSLVPRCPPPGFMTGTSMAIVLVCGVPRLALGIIFAGVVLLPRLNAPSVPAMLFFVFSVSCVSEILQRS